MGKFEKTKTSLVRSIVACRAIKFFPIVWSILPYLGIPVTLDDYDVFLVNFVNDCL